MEPEDNAGAPGPVHSSSKASNTVNLAWEKVKSAGKSLTGNANTHTNPSAKTASASHLPLERCPEGFRRVCEASTLRSIAATWSHADKVRPATATEKKGRSSTSQATVQQGDVSRLLGTLRFLDSADGQKQASKILTQFALDNKDVRVPVPQRFADGRTRVVWKPLDGAMLEVCAITSKGFRGQSSTCHKEMNDFFSRWIAFFVENPSQTIQFGDMCVASPFTLAGTESTWLVWSTHRLDEANVLRHQAVAAPAPEASPAKPESLPIPQAASLASVASSTTLAHDSATSPVHETLDDIPPPHRPHIDSAHPSRSSLVSMLMGMLPAPLTADASTTALFSPSVRASTASLPGVNTSTMALRSLASSSMTLSVADLPLTTPTASPPASPTGSMLSLRSFASSALSLPSTSPKLTVSHASPDSAPTSPAGHPTLPKAKKRSWSDLEADDVGHSETGSADADGSQPKEKRHKLGIFSSIIKSIKGLHGGKPSK